MGASVESPKGKRSVSFELNLVPFIDLLSVMITFLLATAALAQVEALQVDQEVATGDAPLREGPPMLRVSVEHGAVRINRGEVVTNVPNVDGSPDWAAVDTILDADRAAWPGEDGIVIAAQDGIRYEHVMQALDRTRGKGYQHALIGASAP